MPDALDEIGLVTRAPAISVHAIIRRDQYRGCGGILRRARGQRWFYRRINGAYNQTGSLLGPIGCPNLSVWQRHGGDGQIGFLGRLIDAEGGHSKDGAVMPAGVGSSYWLKRIGNLVHVGRESNDQRPPAEFFLSVLCAFLVFSVFKINIVFIVNKLFLSKHQAFILD